MLGDRRRWIVLGICIVTLVGGVVVVSKMYWKGGPVRTKVVIKDVATGELASYLEEGIHIAMEECGWFTYEGEEALRVWTYKENISLWVEMINWSAYHGDYFEWIELKLIVESAPEESGLKKGDVLMVVNETVDSSYLRNLAVPGEYVFDIKLRLYAREVTEDVTISWDIWFYLVEGVYELGECKVLWSDYVEVSA